MLHKLKLGGLDFVCMSEGLLEEEISELELVKVGGEEEITLANVLM